MKRLRKKASGIWEYYFYDKKKSPSRKYIQLKAGNQEDAELEALQKLQLYRKGNYDPWLQITDDLEEAVNKYLDDCSELRASTLKMKRSQLNIFLKSTHLRSFILIDHNIIAHYVTAMDKPSSRAYRLSVISSFWKWCISKGYTENNPVQMFKDSTRVRISMDYSEREPCTMQQYLQVQGVAQSKNETLSPFLELAISTGLRSSELVSLNVRDVKLSGLTGSINIRSWIHPKTGEKFDPKTNKRIVPLTPRAALVLKSLLDDMATDDPWRPVFSGSRKPRASGSTLGHLFTEIRKDLGIGHEITLHSTRHAYLTWLMACGVDPYTILKVAGHGDLKTQQKYVHYMDEMLSGGAAQVRQELTAFFCPGVKPEVLRFAFPDKSTFYSSIVKGSKLDVLDILFGGLLYDEGLIAQVQKKSINKNLNQN